MLIETSYTFAAFNKSRASSPDSDASGLQASNRHLERPDTAH
jgi:hypothetical protein